MSKAAETETEGRLSLCYTLPRMFLGLYNNQPKGVTNDMSYLGTYKVYALITLIDFP